MNTPYYSQSFSRCMIHSREEALRMNSKELSCEHLILGILKDANNLAYEILQTYCEDTSLIRAKMIRELNWEPSQIEPSNNILMADRDVDHILHVCISRVQGDPEQIITPELLLLSIMENSHSQVPKILTEMGLTKNKVLEYIESHRTTESNIENEEFDDEMDEEDPLSSGEVNEPRKSSFINLQNSGNKESKTPLLEKFGVDITALAKEGKLDIVVGREKEIERIAQILCRRKKNNPILIGEPGVGKTAIVEGLAQRIEAMNVPVILLNKRIVSLSMSGLVAGTKFRGQFEERMLAIMKEIQENPDIIIFIDEIHTLIGAGATAGSLDAANILKPALSRGQIQCIGATTIEEYRKTIEKDGAMERRFQKIMVEPTTSEETLQILQQIKTKYEQHHNVTFTDEALAACVKLTDRYVTDRQQPDKAIDVMDEAGSKAKMGGNSNIPKTLKRLKENLSDIKKKQEEAVQKNDFENACKLRDTKYALTQKIDEELQLWSENNQRKPAKVDIDLIEKTVSLMSGIPVQKMAKDETIHIKGLRKNLSGSIIQQDKAIDTLTKAIMRNRIGLRDPNKPIGTFLFTGPTGVGKTYLAQKLAENLFGSKDALIRIDMSEYMEKYSTSRLVGAPPGYVGYNEGGQLTEQVRRHPYSIVLLDEIEKASHDVFSILLQVMDEGRLTDSQGVTVDFRNTIIIFTSNVGSRQVQEFGNGVGFTESQTSAEREQEIVRKALSKLFAPEFINRIDEIIHFSSLNKDSIKKIAKLEISKLQERMKSMGYNFTLTPSALDFLAEKGFDPKLGARPLKRAIQTYIEDLIGMSIMEETILPGSSFKITKVKDCLVTT